jgi:hypothetical protein
MQYKLKNPWNSYLSPYNIRIDYHWNGKKTKVDRRDVNLQLPDPIAIKVDTIEGLHVAALVPLIEMKLECELRRQLGQPCDTKHRNDVLALIRLKHLDESYANNLPTKPDLQKLFLQLVNENSIQCSTGVPPVQHCKKVT